MVAAPDRRPSPHRAPTDGLQRERLANGLTLLMQRRRTVPGVALVCHVRAGFLDEPDPLAGISHVLEHMLFKGTPTLGPGDLARVAKGFGGALNAYTAYDRTVYYMTGPARHARDLIALQADQVRRPLLDAGELSRELGVIIQEARRKLDTPSAVAGEQLHELLFATHRIRRWRIGTEDVLEHLTRDDVAGYYASRYLPARTIVSLVGDIDEAAALDALREFWEDWRGNAPPPEPGPVETALPAVRARTLTGEVATANLVVGWRGPGLLDEQLPALELATTVLAGGRAARLGRLLRDPGLVTGVGAGCYGVIDAGVLAIGAELEAKHLAAALPVLGGAVRDLVERPVPADEIARARAVELLRVRRRLERFEARATAFAEAEALGDVTRVDREESDLLAVDAPALRDAAARYLGQPGAAVWYLRRPRSAARCGRAGIGARGSTACSRRHPRRRHRRAARAGAAAISPDLAGRATVERRRSRRARGATRRHRTGGALDLPASPRRRDRRDRGAGDARHPGHAARHPPPRGRRTGRCCRVARRRDRADVLARRARIRHDRSWPKPPTAPRRC